MIPKGKNWKLLGHAAVDSGQLMVCDPCYIESEWKPGTAPQGHPAYVLTAEGKKRFPKAGPDWSWRYNYAGTTYDSPQELLDGLSINEARDQKLIKEVPNPKSNEFSYKGACSLTVSEERSGEMTFKKGHTGAGVAFSSGYGDGYYAVWGKFNNENHIIEIRVLMG